MADTVKKADIKYYALDFNDTMERFKEFAKIHYPDIYRDFSTPSSGMMMVEFLSFVADVCNMRMDHNYDEQFLDTATEPKTLFKKANSEGYKIPGKAPASGDTYFYITVPSTSTTGSVYTPNLDYAITLKPESKAYDNGRPYELIEDVKFSEVDTRDRSQVVVKTRNAQGQPTHYALKKKGKILAGITKSYDVTVGDYSEYKVVTLPDADISQIINVVDSEGNRWYEVDFLAQDTVFVREKNTANDLGEVPNVLRSRPAPYRYEVRRNPNSRKWELQFGAGSANDAASDIVPNVGDLALPLFGKNSFTDPHIDPQNFLRSKTLGMAPSNTTLTIKYRIGGGLDTNAASNAINQMGEAKYEENVSGLNAGTLSEVINSISTLNEDPISGGADGLSIEQMRRMIKAFKAAQMRCVSIEDYMYKAYTMPAEFGSVFRAFARRNPLNKQGTQLYVLARSRQGYLQNATSTLKTNLQTFFKNTTEEAVDLMDVNIVNLAVTFSIVATGERNKHEILTECLQKLKDHFAITNWQIGQPIVISKLSDLLDDVAGVYSVASIKLLNRTGIVDNLTYSNRIFSVTEHSKNGIVYAPEHSMFEIKYPNKDIAGRVV